MPQLQQKGIESTSDKLFGFKGFKKGLVCRKFQYSINETYVHDGEISLCNRGFHFCYRLSDVFSHYSKNFARNEFAIVEPQGKLLIGNDKAVTNKLKIHRILTPEEIEIILEREQAEEYEKDVFCLDLVYELQQKYNFAIGGSCALFLQGLTLERKKGQTDFDIIMPYYQRFTGSGELVDEIEEFNGKPSGNDYSHTFALTAKDGRFIKLDVKIKPEQTYKIVSYKGKEYKVCDIMTILAAKIKYAQEGNKKHQEDIMSLLLFDKGCSSNKNEPEYLKEDYILKLLGGKEKLSGPTIIKEDERMLTFLYQNL